MGEMYMPGRGGGPEKELRIIDILRDGKNYFMADEAVSGPQYHCSHTGSYGGSGASGPHHDLTLFNKSGGSLGMIRYGLTSRTEASVYQCTFASPSEFELETATGGMLRLVLWVEKQTDGTLDIYNSAGTRKLLSGVSKAGYGEYNSDVLYICIAFLADKE